MTNVDKYKTAKERAEAFIQFCDTNDAECIGCPLYGNSSEPRTCAIHWLYLECEYENPLPCPFCGGDVHVSIPANTGDRKMYQVGCFVCGYKSTMKESSNDAISAHNRVEKAVMESEEEK